LQTPCYWPFFVALTSEMRCMEHQQGFAWVFPHLRSYGNTHRDLRSWIGLGVPQPLEPNLLAYESKSRQGNLAGGEKSIFFSTLTLAWHMTCPPKNQ